MADLKLYDKEGKESGTIPVEEGLFGKIIRKKLLHQVVVIYEGNLRQGSASTKGRSEVSYSTKKPWPQKHTGMARAGSRRSPIWRHGGTPFGPKPRSYRKNMTPKMKRAALDSALLGKIRDGEVAVIESIQMKKPRTKDLAKVLKNTGLDGRILIGIHENDNAAWLSARNIADVSLSPVSDLNAYEILKHKRLLLTKGALEKLVAARKSGKGGEKE